ncbi:TetR family transcriptional regulator [Sinimarinibacterium sp. NLF-5-8]|uniref:TetR family transcriptional regulator n=1 Tax=Sinimarinibacterium sp. NLF-5-8 TaxID=2698684 RepID=UPI00137BD415|nr:TetR family transcriptional regulator [Sinimarinibacterium sp. NLF-5-8]QHS09340.1 TetR family transcriptional regulator [Sinimarinibacterium sp. NLF-5-8]
MQDKNSDRNQRKRLTRERLMDAALTLMSQGHSFPSVSLREITREAGVVPTAFYRHFADLDALGLALMAECGDALRALLRDARAGQVLQNRDLRVPLRWFWQYARANPLPLRALVSERNGGAASLRRALRDELALLARELAQDLRHAGFCSELPLPQLEMIAALMLDTLLGAVSDILDLPDDQVQPARELEQRLTDQMRVIVLGARQWRRS